MSARFTRTTCGILSVNPKESCARPKHCDNSTKICDVSRSSRFFLDATIYFGTFVSSLASWGIIGIEVIPPNRQYTRSLEWSSVNVSNTKCMSTHDLLATKSNSLSIANKTQWIEIPLYNRDGTKNPVYLSKKLNKTTTSRDVQYFLINNSDKKILYPCFCLLRRHCVNLENSWSSPSFRATQRNVNGDFLPANFCTRCCELFGRLAPMDVQISGVPITDRVAQSCITNARNSGRAGTNTLNKQGCADIRSYIVH